LFLLEEKMRPFLTVALALATLSLSSRLCEAQESVHWDVAAQIRAEGFENSSVTEFVSYLADVIGPRLTGSPNMRQAQQWLVEQMEDIGLTDVRLESTGDNTIGWELERTSIHMLAPDYQMVIGYPMAFSKGTDGPVIDRAVIADISSAEDLDRFRGSLNGAIVLATPKMPVTPRFVPDAFRHDEDSLHIYETEGVDLNMQRYGRGQPNQTRVRLDGITQAEIDEFYVAEGAAAVL